MFDLSPDMLEYFLRIFEEILVSAEKKTLFLHVASDEEGNDRIILVALDPEGIRNKDENIYCKPLAIIPHISEWSEYEPQQMDLDEDEIESLKSNIEKAKRINENKRDKKYISLNKIPTKGTFNYGPRMGS